MEAVRGVVAAATNAVTTSANNSEPKGEPEAHEPVVTSQAVDTVSISSGDKSSEPTALVTTDGKKRADAEKSDEKKSAAADVLNVTATVVEFATQGQGDEKRILSFRVVDRATGRILREFPPDKLPTMLSEAHSTLDFSAGRILNKKA